MSSDPTLALGRSGSATPRPAYTWPMAGAVLTVHLIVLLAVFRDTVWSIVEIWQRSETFSHGFAILPISLFLIWRRHRQLAFLRPTADMRALWALPAVGFTWLLADLAEVQVARQFAMVAMIPLLVWLLLGERVTRRMLFPLAYIFFAVPFGEFLILPLMQFTADFTVALVRLSGIPVFREGLFFSLPSGHWSVVEGCSGLRYLVASVALGTLYAYLTYRSYSRRAVFIAASVLVPIVANGLRAYMIVMIGHLSGMQLAVGVDHLIYGWVFFGFVMLLMFWAGAYWRQEPDTGDRPPAGSVAENAGPTMGRVLAAAGTGLLAVIVWPVWGAYLQGPPPDAFAGIRLETPGVAGWEGRDGGLTEWSPRYRGMDRELHAGYALGGDRVGLYVAYYLPHAEQGEVINSQNVMTVQKHPRWQMLSTAVRRAPEGLDIDGIREADMRLDGHRMLTWSWYWIGGRHLTNPVRGKLLEAYSPLLGLSPYTAGVVVYAPYDTHKDEARAVLAEFLGDALDPLDAALNAPRETFGRESP